MSMSYVEEHIRYNNPTSLDIPEWYITKIEKEPRFGENITPIALTLAETELTLDKNNAQTSVSAHNK